jgi:hypothetical protein
MDTDFNLIDNMFANTANKDDKIRYEAFQTLLALTDEKVDWVYDKWYDLLEKLDSENSYQRSIGFLLLANLSKSDTDNRISLILNKLTQLFDDEKFITSRQCIQNVWKIAICSLGCKSLIIFELLKTYYDNIHNKKHGNLIKQDVIFSLNKIYQSEKDNDVFAKIEELISLETDVKFQKTLRKIIS